MTSPDRPLVTFLIISYNQAPFIREAVEAVFAQDYQPLQIVLSDDCSSDDTFRIMQQMAADYDGPHQVVVRQTPRNSGTVGHVMNAIPHCQGELILLAAGDDKSRPNRTSRTFEEWQSSGAWGLHCRYDTIDQNGGVISTNDHSAFLLQPDYPLRTYFHAEDGEVGIVHGTTSAYDRRLFEHLQNMDDLYILAEDGVLSIIINALKKPVHGFADSLVLYRVHAGSLTNAGGMSGYVSLAQIKAELVKEQRYQLSNLNRLNLVENLKDYVISDDLRPVNLPKIRRDRKIVENALYWYDMSIARRFRALFDPELKQRRGWMLVRFFGKAQFFSVKFLFLNSRYLVRCVAGKG